MKFTLGTNFDVFVEDASKNKFIPSWEIINNNRDSPLMLSSDNNYSMCINNAAIEISIKTVKNKKEFIKSIIKGKQLLEAYLNNLSPNYRIINDMCTCLTNAQHRHPIGRNYDLDYNAYSEKNNSKPTFKVQSRFANGNINIGYELNDFNTLINLVKRLDFYVGLWTTKYTPTYLETRRRKRCGKAGDFIIENHELKYKVLSNFWIFDPNIMEKMYERISMAINDTYDVNNVINDTLLKSLMKEAINNVDNNLAKHVYKLVEERTTEKCMI